MIFSPKKGGGAASFASQPRFGERSMGNQRDLGWVVKMGINVERLYARIRPETTWLKICIELIN